MPLRNTEQAYGSVAKFFHWIIGILIIALIIVGLTMVNVDPSPKVFKVYALHKSIGILVLMLATLRVLWRLAGQHVFPLPNHQIWEKALARIVHFLLYVAMFVMPLSGWVMSSAKNFSVSFFGLFTLPNFVAPDDHLAELAVNVHNICAFTLIGILALHIAGALKHHFIDRDTTLKRMLPGKVSS